MSTDRTVAPSWFLVLAASLAIWGTPARAIPAFARKYGVTCNACHESWPKLNDQGKAFEDNGFQWGNGQDEPMKLNPAYWPISLRGAVGYQYSSLSNQATNQGPTTIQGGRLGYTTLKITMAGTVARDISVFAILEPLLTNAGFNPQYPSPNAAISTPGQIGLMEYFWVRFDNLLGKSWLNFKVGLAELDLPFDQDETLTPINPYSVYQYHPGGSANFLPFALGASQFEAAVEGHSQDDSARYSLAYVQTQDDPGSALPLASPGVYLHVQKSFDLWPNKIPEITVGLMGLAGSYPTKALYLGGPPGSPNSGSLVTNPGAATQPGSKSCSDPDDCGSADTSQQTGSTGPNVVPNTGYALREFYKEGVDLSLYFGNPSVPLNISGAYILGQEDPAFIANATREAVYQGGWVEADWTPLLQLTLVARWDFIRNLRQADPTAPPDYLDSDQATAAVRYTFELLPKTAVTLHGELSYRHVAGGGFNGAVFDGFLAFGGIDLAF
jgi:hypothetical protein